MESLRTARPLCCATFVSPPEVCTTMSSKHHVLLRSLWNLARGILLDYLGSLPPASFLTVGAVLKGFYLSRMPSWITLCGLVSNRSCGLVPNRSCGLVPNHSCGLVPNYFCGLVKDCRAISDIFVPGYLGPLPLDSQRTAIGLPQVLPGGRAGLRSDPSETCNSILLMGLSPIISCFCMDSFPCLSCYLIISWILIFSICCLICSPDEQLINRVAAHRCFLDFDILSTLPVSIHQRMTISTFTM